MTQKNERQRPTIATALASSRAEGEAIQSIGNRLDCVASLDMTGTKAMRQTAANEQPIEITFLGTRGEIKARSRRHRRHSSLLVQLGDARIMIDCGADWRDRLDALSPTALVLTHAHPDHAAGLLAGAPCPVYATKETLDLLARYPIRDRRPISPRQSVTIGKMSFEAFPVEHSVRAPAVGYRIAAGESCFFYVPDVAAIPSSAAALRGVGLYIGDGATIRRSMVRRKNGAPIGHAPITAQLSWCEKAGVRNAIFTHCGSQIVRGDAGRAEALVLEIGREHRVDARIAYDGLRLSVANEGSSLKRLDDGALTGKAGSGQVKASN